MIDHGLGDIAVQVQRHAQRHTGRDAADLRQQCALAIVGAAIMDKSGATKDTYVRAAFADHFQRAHFESALSVKAFSPGTRAITL